MELPEMSAADLERLRVGGLEQYEEYKKSRKPFDLHTLRDRFDGEGDISRLWFEALCKCEENQLEAAAELFALTVLVFWDVRAAPRFSLMYPRKQMEMYIQSNKSKVCPEFLAAHLVLVSELNSNKLWKRLENVVERYPACGAAVIMCGRAASDSSSIGQRFASQDLCDYYGAMFEKGFAMLPKPASTALSLIWERSYVCELWAREDGIPDLEAAKKHLEEYFALAPKSHFQYETAIFTQSRVLKAAELLKSRDTSYANQFHRSMADVTRCNACNLVKAKLYMCSGCKVARYCSTECSKKDWQSHKKDCLRWREAIDHVKSSDEKLYKVQIPLLGGGGDLMVYDKNKQSPLWMNFLNPTHPQYNELVSEVMRRGASGLKGYFYAKPHKEHKLWFQTALAKANDSW